MVDFVHKESYDMQDLIDIIRLLRSPGGCPWDQEQTHLSNRRNFLEEAYETVEGFDQDDPKIMQEELGDMLLQVLFNVRIEEELGRFELADVTNQVCKKLIFRHPHVFGTARADNSGEVLVKWEEQKRKEKGLSSNSDVLDAVARSLPALWRADKLQSKASKAGFEWKDVNGALQKLQEETDELQQAVLTGGDVEDELGDVLFAAVKVGRFSGADPEVALHRTCEKFIRRFRYVEQQLAEQGKDMSAAPLEEMTKLWNEAKTRG